MGRRQTVPLMECWRHQGTGRVARRGRDRVAWTVPARSPQPSTRAPPRMTPPLNLPELPVRKITLPNGLDVLALRSGFLPVVAVNLWYHVGSKNEERTQRGFAHL